MLVAEETDLLPGFDREVHSLSAGNAGGAKETYRKLRDTERSPMTHAFRVALGRVLFPKATPGLTRLRPVVDQMPELQVGVA